MSTVHEVVVARHSGIKVLGFSLITNIANHEEVLKAGRKRSVDMKTLVSAIVGKI